MKIFTLFKNLFILALLFFGAGSVLGAEFTVTYTISAKNTLTTTGASPTGSSATIVETYNTSKQMTAGNSQTLKLSGYKDCVIKSITLSAKSNASKGAGSFVYIIDEKTTNIIEDNNFNTSEWAGKWSTAYIDVKKTELNIECKSDEIIFKILASINSLYCESYTIVYEKEGVSTYFPKPEITPNSAIYYEPLKVSIGTYRNDTIIYYTTDGTEPTAESTLYTAPFTISENTVVKAIAFAGEEKSDITEAKYTFPVEVSNISAFLAAGDTENAEDEASYTGTIVYKITGSVTVTSKNGQNTYVEDESGSLLLYGTVSEDLTNGNVLTGVSGTFKNFYNLPELMVTNVPASTEGTAVAPVVITEIPVAADANKYVRLNAVTFDSDPDFKTDATISGKANFTGTTITIRDNFRLGFEIEAEKEYDIIGYVSIYNATIQIFPISITDAEKVVYANASTSTIDATFGSATVNGETSLAVAVGTELSFTATPATGYQFVKWTTKENEVVSTENPYVATSTEADLDLIAVFTPIEDPNSIETIVTLKPYVSGDQIIVPAQIGQSIEIFNVTGQKVYNYVANSTLVSVKVQQGQIYIVRVGGSVVKVSL